MVCMVEPDAVAVAHRRRLLDALDESIRSVGYANTTVADIVRRARASRRTFYQHFPDREAALVALLTDTNESTGRAVAPAVDPAEPWQAQIRQAITAWIARSESHPALTLSWI